jgi:hypothetical protein
VAWHAHDVEGCSRAVSEENRERSEDGAIDEGVGRGDSVVGRASGEPSAEDTILADGSPPPDDAPPSVHRFRALPVFVVLAWLALPPAILWLVVDPLAPPPPAPPRAPVGPLALTIGIAAGLLVCAAASLLMQRTMGTVVRAASVQGYDWLNLPRSLAWPDVDRVVPFGFLGLRFVRLVPDRGRSIWQPLFLVDPDAFAAAVVAHAGPEHPLARALGGGPAAGDVDEDPDAHTAGESVHR